MSESTRELWFFKHEGERLHIVLIRPPSEKTTELFIAMSRAQYDSIWPPDTRQMESLKAQCRRIENRWIAAGRPSPKALRPVS